MGYAVDYTKKARTDVHRAKIARNRNIKVFLNLLLELSNSSF